MHYGKRQVQSELYAIANACTRVDGADFLNLTLPEHLHLHLLLVKLLLLELHLLQVQISCSRSLLSRCVGFRLALI